MSEPPRAPSPAVRPPSDAPLLPSPLPRPAPAADAPDGLHRATNGSGDALGIGATPPSPFADAAAHAAALRGVLEPRLREQLALVIDWLKFAEAKHAFLLAFNGAALAALGAAAKDFRAAAVAPPSWLAAYVAWCALMAVLAVAVSLTAVIPELQVPWQFGRTATVADTNLVYYGHIADLDAGAYADAIAHAVGAPEGWRATRWELDLAGQVVANAQIAARLAWPPPSPSGGS